MSKKDILTDFNFFQNLTPKMISILEEAKKEFSQKGFYEASVDTIASNAQVGKGTIYRYFGNKESLFIAVATYSCKSFHEIIKNKNTYESFEKTLKELINDYIKNYFENKDFIKIFSHQISKLIVDPFLKEKLILILKLGISLIKNIVTKAKENNEIKNSIDEDLLSEFLWEQIHHFIPKRMILFDSSQEEIKKYSDFIIDVMLKGILKEN